MARRSFAVGGDGAGAGCVGAGPCACPDPILQYPDVIGHALIHFCNVLIELGNHRGLPQRIMAFSQRGYRSDCYR